MVRPWNEVLTFDGFDVEQNFSTPRLPTVACRWNHAPVLATMIGSVQALQPYTWYMAADYQPYL